MLQEDYSSFKHCFFLSFLFVFVCLFLFVFCFLFLSFVCFLALMLLGERPTFLEGAVLRGLVPLRSLCGLTRCRCDGEGPGVFVFADLQYRDEGWCTVTQAPSATQRKTRWTRVAVGPRVSRSAWSLSRLVSRLWECVESFVFGLTSVGVRGVFRVWSHVSGSTWSLSCLVSRL